MKRSVLFASLALLVVGCAPYKQLKPKVVLSSNESGYVELKKDEKKDFKIKEGKQYFIAFPRPAEDNFYLVISLKDRPVFKDALTDKLEKKKIPGKRIKDDASNLDTLSVYPIDNGAQGYFWLLEKVTADQEIKMTYRYVPQWRFKFENKHDEYKATLEENRIDRTASKTLGTKHHFETFNFEKAKDTVSRHSAALDTVKRALLAIESIFPKSILNSKDKAYQDYLKLRKELDEEVDFQKLYMAVMDFFHDERNTRNDVPAFVDLSGKCIGYFGLKDKMADNVLTESRAVLTKRMDEVAPYYDRLLKTKEDASPFDPEKFHMKGFMGLAKLHTTADVKPSEAFAAVDMYMRGFEERATGLRTARGKTDAIRKEVSDLKTMPPVNFFETQAGKMTVLARGIPGPIEREYGKYRTLRCTKALNKALAADGKAFDDLAAQYRRAELVVAEVNPMLVRLAYPEALGIVMQYKDLAFLLEKYKPLDNLSLRMQQERIQDALLGYRWREAESLLTRLHQDRNFIEPTVVGPVKTAAVSDLEDTLYMQVDKATRYRVFKFLKLNVETFEDVDSLYENPVFLPVHDVRFTTGGKRALLKRKAELVEHLAKMKEYEFPARAVKILYDKFIKDPGANGVLRARAIVTHGGHYKGEDKKTKRMVAECNPISAKWIVKPAKYRRVFVMPVTSRRRGENLYRFRLNIRIPSKAKFPVYDVNIKLPKGIAQSAGEQQWYETITLNKKVLKNEGRFTIGAPTAASGWECQITPVRMKKDHSNILDVRLKHKSFKVHQISVMVQKPIIKKN